MSAQLLAGEPAQLRLLVPAAAAWSAAGVALSVPERRGLLAGVLLAAAGAFAATYAARDARRLRCRVVAAALLCASAAAVATGWRVAAVHRGPLPALARAHARVTLELVVTSDPHLSAASKTGAARPLVVLLARAVEVATTNGSTKIRSPVVVLAAGSGWLSLQPTQRVSAVGRVVSPNPGELEAAVFDTSTPPTRLGSPSVVQRLAGKVRAGLRAAAAPLPSGPRGLLPGLVDGDTSGLPPALAADFRTTGLTHIVAVSGANVAIMLGAALAAARWAGAGLRAQALTGALTVVAFVIVARPQASVLRAAAMGLVAVLALATGRRRRALPALCAAVLCLIYIDPALSRSVGFALSVFATAALLLLAPMLRDRMARRLPLWLAEALAVPTAATIVCAPLIVSISGRVSLSSIPANLLAEPAVAPATILGVATACVAPFSMPIAQLLAHAAGLPCVWLAFVAHSFATLPGSAVTWRDGAIGALELTTLMVCVVVLGVWHATRSGLGGAQVGSSRDGRGRARRVAVGVTVVVAVVIGCLVLARRAPVRWPQPDWTIAACDVAPGRAIVARTAATAALLVDAGSAPTAVDACLLALGVREVPEVILSSGALGAIGGIPGVLHGRMVGAFDMSAGSEDEQRVRGWATAGHVGVAQAVLGQEHVVGDVRWQVTSDTGSSRGIALATSRLTALVVGDAPRVSQTSSVDVGRQITPDVLVLPSRAANASDGTFVDNAQPLVAIVSTGATLGHAASDPVLKALLARGTPTLRADRDGDVAISVISQGLRVLTRKGSDRVVARRTGAAVPSDVRPVVVAAHISSAWPSGRMACCPAWQVLRVPAAPDEPRHPSPSWRATRISWSSARSPP